MGIVEEGVFLCKNFGIRFIALKCNPNLDDFSDDCLYKVDFDGY